MNEDEFTNTKPDLDIPPLHMRKILTNKTKKWGEKCKGNYSQVENEKSKLHGMKDILRAILFFVLRWNFSGNGFEESCKVCVRGKTHNFWYIVNGIAVFQ